MSVEDALLAGLVGLAIGFSKAGVAGLMTLVGPLVTWMRGASFANGMTLPLLIVGDIFVLWKLRGRWDLRVILPMLPGAAVGIILAGTTLLGPLVAHPRLFNQVIGGIALFFCGVQLWLEWQRARVTRANGGDAPEHQPAPPLAGAAAGAATGVLSTIANQGGLVTNLYLLSQRLSKERFVGSAAVLYFCINTSKVPFFAGNGLINAQTLWLDLAGVPFVIAGGFLGAWVLKHINETVFNQLILWLTVLTGLKLVIWP